MAFKMAGLDMDEGEIKVTEDLLVSLINLMRDTGQKEMSIERAISEMSSLYKEQESLKEDERADDFLASGMSGVDLDDDIPLGSGGGGESDDSGSATSGSMKDSNVNLDDLEGDLSNFNPFNKMSDDDLNSNASETATPPPVRSPSRSPPRSGPFGKPVSKSSAAEYPAGHESEGDIEGEEPSVSRPRQGETPHTMKFGSAASDPVFDPNLSGIPDINEHDSLPVPPSAPQQPKFDFTAPPAANPEIPDFNGGAFWGAQAESMPGQGFNMGAPSGEHRRRPVKGKKSRTNEMGGIDSPSASSGSTSAAGGGFDFGTGASGAFSPASTGSTMDVGSEGEGSPFSRSSAKGFAATSTDGGDGDFIPSGAAEEPGSGTLPKGRDFGEGIGFEMPPAVPPPVPEGEDEGVDNGASAADKFAASAFRFLCSSNAASCGTDSFISANHICCIFSALFFWYILWTMLAALVSMQSASQSWEPRISLMIFS